MAAELSSRKLKPDLAYEDAVSTLGDTGLHDAMLNDNPQADARFEGDAYSRAIARCMPAETAVLFHSHSATGNT